MTALPPYVPLDGKPWRLAMGLRPLPVERWLEVDASRSTELDLKERLLRETPEAVVGALPGSDAAAQELLDTVVAHMADHHPGLIEVAADGRIQERTSGRVIDPAVLRPVDTAGRLVQEDLCVMARRDGAWRLIAASLCFPSRWQLADKLGRDLSAIHAPVPGYEQLLARPTVAFFDRLRRDRPVWRLNWTLIDRSDLHQPDPGSRRTEGTRTDAGEWSLWFRVERQTLRRLVVDDAVVFTIRTYVTSLGQLVASHPETIGALQATLPTVPEATLRYKGWAGLTGSLIAWLDERSRSV